MPHPFLQRSGPDLLKTKSPPNRRQVPVQGRSESFVAVPPWFDALGSGEPNHLQPSSAHPSLARSRGPSGALYLPPGGFRSRGSEASSAAASTASHQPAALSRHALPPTIPHRRLCIICGRTGERSRPRRLVLPSGSVTSIQLHKASSRGIRRVAADSPCGRQKIRRRLNRFSDGCARNGTLRQSRCTRKVLCADPHSVLVEPVGCFKLSRPRSVNCFTIRLYDHLGCAPPFVGPFGVALIAYQEVTPAKIQRSSHLQCLFFLATYRFG